MRHDGHIKCEPERDFLPQVKRPKNSYFVHVLFPIYPAQRMTVT